MRKSKDLGTPTARQRTAREELREKIEKFIKPIFVREEELCSNCHHHIASHYWTSIPSGDRATDSCLVDGCKCVGDDDKTYVKETCSPYYIEHMGNIMAALDAYVREVIGKNDILPWSNRLRNEQRQRAGLREEKE